MTIPNSVTTLLLRYMVYCVAGENSHGSHAAHEASTPVDVTGADATGGLSLARALRGLGVPLYGLASDPRAPCCRSSAWTEVWPVSDDSEEGWMDALLKLSDRHDKQVLFAAQDTVVDYIVTQPGGT